MNTAVNKPTQEELIDKNQFQERVDEKHLTEEMVVKGNAVGGKASEQWTGTEKAPDKIAVDKEQGSTAIAESEEVGPVIDGENELKAAAEPAQSVPVSHTFSEEEKWANNELKQCPSADPFPVQGSPVEVASLAGKCVARKQRTLVKSENYMSGGE